MNLERRIWILIGKKLAGEATDSEQTELRELANRNADVRFYMEVMAGWWHIAKYKGQKEATLIFNKQLDQIIDKRLRQGSTSVPPTLGHAWSVKKDMKKSRIKIFLGKLIRAIIKVIQ
jgi:hypothetical protein